MTNNIVTVSRNSSNFLYTIIKNVIKNPIILRRGKKNIAKVIQYSLFNGFNTVLILSKTTDQNIIKINKLKININGSDTQYKSNIYLYDLNEHRKIFYNTKNPKNKKFY